MKTENKSHTPKDIKDLWQTPKKLFNKMNDDFEFFLDVAASDYNHLCDMYFTEEENALEQDWSNSNWCNPPYSNITPWVDKAIEENKKGNRTVMLVPSDTSVKWFKKAYETCTGIWFISGRISFVNATTQIPVNGNNKGSVLLIWEGCSTNRPSVRLINREDLLC